MVYIGTGPPGGSTNVNRDAANQGSAVTEWDKTIDGLAEATRAQRPVRLARTTTPSFPPSGLLPTAYSPLAAASANGRANAGGDEGGQPAQSDKADPRTGAAGGHELSKKSVLEESRPVTETKPLVDPSQIPAAEIGPLTGKPVGMVGNQTLQAGKQYGPAFPTADAAAEYARLGLKRGWFAGGFLSFLGWSAATNGAAVVRTQGGYAVYGIELPRGFSTQDPPPNLPALVQVGAGLSASVPRASANDVAGSLKAVKPNPSLVALVSQEGAIGDYRGPQPKAEFAGLDGDATAGEIELLGPGATGPQATDISLFPDAVTHQAQAVLDIAQYAGETMRSYIGRDKKFSPEGETAVANALNDTRDTNKQIIEKEKEFAEAAEKLKQDNHDSYAYFVNHHSELHPEPGDRHVQKVAQDTVISLQRRIDDDIENARKIFGELEGLHEQRNQILKDDTAEFLARLTPEKSLALAGKLDGGDAAAKNEVAADLRNDAESVLRDVNKMRTQILNGDFKWSQYAPLIQLTASKLGFDDAQYQALADKLHAMRSREDLVDLGEGALSLGLAFVPGAGWAAMTARGASLALALHMSAKELDAYLTDRSLRNTQIDYDTARNIFSSHGAPGEAGLAMAAISIIPEAKFLIGSTLKALKPGERVSPVMMESWIRASSRADEVGWAPWARNRLRAAAEYYRGSPVSTREVNAQRLVDMTRDDATMAVFHLSRGENGALKANVLVSDDLKAAEKWQWARHEPIHFEQLADPAMRPKMEKLADLETRWPTMSDAEKVEAYRAKLELEIDAYQRMAGRETSAARRETIQAHLRDYNAELADLKAGKTPADTLDPPFLTATRNGRPPAAVGNVQGFTVHRIEKFGRAARQLVREANLPEGELVLQGSRVRGTARADSDLDVALVVDEKTFFELAEKALARTYPGTRLRRTIMRRINENGQLSAFDLGPEFQILLREKLQLLSPYKVQFSVLRRGGRLHTGPFLRIGGKE